MYNTELLEHVKRLSNIGRGEEEMLQALVAAGYAMEDIRHAILTVQADQLNEEKMFPKPEEKKPLPPPPMPSSLDELRRVRTSEPPRVREGGFSLPDFQGVAERAKPKTKPFPWPPVVAIFIAILIIVALLVVILPLE